MMNAIQGEAKAAARAMEQRADERVTAWHVRASTGDAATRAQLAVHYKDPESAQGLVQDYLSEAANGNVNAMIKIGYLYASGTVVAKNEDVAYKFYVQALFSRNAVKSQRDDVARMMTVLLGAPVRYNVKDKAAWFVNPDNSKSQLVVK